LGVVAIESSGGYVWPQLIANGREFDGGAYLERASISPRRTGTAPSVTHMSHGINVLRRNLRAPCAHLVQYWPANTEIGLGAKGFL
jgi:hypothetical protein